MPDVLALADQRLRTLPDRYLALEWRAGTAPLSDGPRPQRRGCRCDAGWTPLISASADNTIRIWDLSSGNEALTLLIRNHDWASAGVALAPDGQRAVSVSPWFVGLDSQSLEVWDLACGEQLRR